MKFMSAATLFLSAFGTSFVAAFEEKSPGRGVEEFAENNVADEERRLQEEEEDDQVTFQLKMYWEEGYRWQEEDFERKWCLQCDGSCESGKLLEIQTCGGSSRQRFVYEEVLGSGGGRLKPKDRQDLCWTRQGAQVHELEPCDLNCRQIILGIQYEGRFEMHPNGLPLDCLEQHHHPRAGEVVRAKDCIESRGDDTSYWVMINKRGGNYTEAKEEEVLRGSTNITDIGNDVCDDDNKCGLCMGDCDRDSDCQEGLECMQRDGNETVPGCDGADIEANDGVDVCYDPYGNYTLPPTMAPTTSPAPSAAAPTPPPVELYGDCEFMWPSAAPSPSPTDNPSKSPSASPTFSPTDSPSYSPSLSPQPTVTLAPTLAPTYEGYCEPDEMGMFGTEASNTVAVDYTYELVTTEGADLEEIISLLDRSAVQTVLPTLFSDSCTEAPNRRKLQNETLHNATGASAGGEGAPNYGVNCTGSFLGGYDCTVIDGSVLVFTDADEAYAEVVLPVLKEYMNSGRFNGLHPDIVNVTYLNQTESTIGTSSSGVQNPGLFGILGVAVVAVVIGFFMYRKRKKKDQSLADADQPEEAVAESTSVTKAVPTDSAKASVAIPDVSGNDSIPVDKTFELNPDEEDFGC